jgi:hypothetical protein
MLTQSGYYGSQGQPAGERHGHGEWTGVSVPLGI